MPVDGLLIQQLLINLLENAIKYTPEAAALRVSARALPGQVEVEVADDGPGLPAGQEQRVFEKFFRHQGGHDGFGLGLAIARAIVEAHGGQHPRREPRAPRRALPLHPAHRGRAARRGARPRTMSTVPETGQTPLVLVVDDEPQVLRFLRASLPHQGYRLIEAVDGRGGAARRPRRAAPTRCCSTWACRTWTAWR